MKVLGYILDNNASYLSRSAFTLFQSHQLPFAIEKDKWTYVYQFESAQIICLFADTNPGQELIDNFLLKLQPHQYIVVLSLYHLDDFHTKDYYRDIRNKYLPFTKNVLVCHHNRYLKNDTDEWLVYNDLMFNRHKVYFTEYDKVENILDAVWTRYSNRDTFTIPKDKVAYRYSKKYLSPNYVYGGNNYDTDPNTIPRMFYRKSLLNFLINNLLYDEGYNNDKERFMCNNPNVFATAIIKKGGGLWLPVADKYYRESFFSCYVETLTQSKFKTRSITEKTLDPLIKGNFVFPFSYPGIIEDILEDGFKLPTEFDYSFDLELDNAVRFSKYCSSLKEAIRLSLRELHLIYKKNFYMIENNRNLFFNKPYDSLYDKIIQRVN